MQKAQIRFWFFLTSALGLYLFFIYQLFREKDLLLAVIIFSLLFINMIFLALEKLFLGLKWWWIILLFGIVVSLSLPTANRQTLTAFRLSLASIGLLLYQRKAYIANVRHISRWTYFTNGGYLFSIITTLVFGFRLLGLNSEFPFNCEQIITRNNTIISTSTRPLTAGISFFEDKERLTTPQTQSSEFSSAISSVRSDLKSKVRTNFIDTQKTINQQICKVILDHLNKVYQNPVFQLGVIFALYLLFYGVIRLLVWVISVIAYIVFIILKWLWLYQVNKHQAEVEEIT